MKTKLNKENSEERAKYYLSLVEEVKALNNVELAILKERIEEEQDSRLKELKKVAK